MRGSTPPFFTRSTNSVASSMIVKSAPVSVSNTLSKPRRRSAATILPSTFVPMGMPKHSPSVARMDGAGCTTTCFDGSFSAAQTLSVSSRSVSAPVGHTVMHCPHDTHGLSPKGASNAQAMCVEKPRSAGPMTPTA